MTAQSKFFLTALCALLCALLFPAGAQELDDELIACRPVDKDGYHFWLYTPPTNSYGYDPLPLVVFMHGRSLCGRNLNQVLRYGPLDAVQKGLVIPAIIVAPQNPGGPWNPDKIMDIVDWAVKNYYIDEARIYALGMSLGGYGTMDVAGTFPDRIAAALAMCGGTTLKNMEGLGRLPLWIMHGTSDAAVNIEQSKRVVRFLQDMGLTQQLRYDWVPGASHGALARMFYLRDTYDWLFAHSLDQRGRPVDRSIVISQELMSNAYRTFDKRKSPLRIKH